MQIEIKHGEETKTFDMEKLNEMQLKNLELFLKYQKGELFEELLQGRHARIHRDRSSFERYHKINEVLTQIEAFKFEKEFYRA